MSLVKLWLDISNLLSTKKKPWCESTGVFYWRSVKSLHLEGKEIKSPWSHDSMTRLFLSLTPLWGSRAKRVILLY